MTLATLLVPFDGSWMADRALACATMLQRATGAHLDLLGTAPDVAHANHIASGVTDRRHDVWDGAGEADQGDGPGDPVAIILATIRV